jgi:MYXO-CTERM domain-containing protein
MIRRTSGRATVVGAAIVAWFLAVTVPIPARAGVVTIDASGYQNVQNLAQLALAMQNFNSVNNALPGQYLQSGGSPALSWRVAILPYLGYSQLYAAFDRTKPWDDPANLPLLQQMPAVFRSPADAAGATTTRYEVGAGPNLIFNGPTGTKPTAITDGTSNTLLIGEAATGVPWTAPQDLPVGANPTLTGSGFSSITPGYVPFAFADGSVHFLSSGIDSPTLLHLFQVNDGSVIDPAVKFDYVVVPEPTGPALWALAAFAAIAGRRRV